MMRITRFHRLALLGALATMLPVATIGVELDARATGGIAAVPADGPAMAMASAPDAAPETKLKSGLDALAARDIATARAMRDALPANSPDRHVLAWAIALYGGDQVPSGDIAAAAAMLPSWPGMEALRRNSERALAR